MCPRRSIPRSRVSETPSKRRGPSRPANRAGDRGVAVLAAAVSASHIPSAPPRLLSETGLYAGRGTHAIDPRNRPFSPQYPLWSDGAEKSRWVRLPEGATIDVRNIDRWDFPAGTRFWKEFRFGGRKVETRFLRKNGDGSWTFASYAWNEAQTDAILAPADGLPNVAEIAPGKFHSIPAVTDCRACHVPSEAAPARARRAPRSSASRRCSSQLIAIPARRTRSRSRMTW